VALRPSTRELYRRTARLHVLPHLGKRRLGAITESEIKGWIAKLQDDKVGAATIAAAHRLLRTILNVAVSERIIARNPAAGIETPKLERDEMRFLTPAELGAIADAVPERYRAWSCCSATAAYGSARPPP
jgi:site-specific recombinase XerD